jgi:hypothetical protein
VSIRTKKSTDRFPFVMAGHSPSKTGVNALLSRPSRSGTQCSPKPDARHRRQVYAVCASLTALPGMTKTFD